jgi:hypothetical protein
MKHSLKHGAGYLIVDHRHSPGIAPADVAHVPGEVLTAPGGAVLERDVLTCSHCERTIVLHPLRTRDRGYCPKCHAFICDTCEGIRVKSGACVPMQQVLERAATLAERHLGQPDHPALEALTDLAALTAPGAPRVTLT